MDPAKPSPAPMSARRWLRAMYTPSAIRASERNGSTHLSVLISRYNVCAWTRVLLENNAIVG